MRQHGLDIYGEAPPEYGLDAQTIRTIRYDLSDGRTNHKEEIGGNVLWIIRASNPYAYIDVHFNDLTRDTVRMREGMQLKGVEFSRIYVTHPAQPGEELVLCYTIDKFKDLSIIPPALNNAPLVYDKSQWRETELQRSFIGSGYIAAAVDTYSHVQLWNPDASGVVAIVNNAQLCSSTSLFIKIGYYNTALNALETSGSKHCEGNDPVCEVRSEVNAGILIDNLLTDSYYCTYYAPVIFLKDSFIITPNHGLLAFSTIKNKTLSLCFEWLEYAEPLVGLG